MKTELKKLIGSLKYGNIAVVHNVAVVPLFTDETNNLEYLTLDEAYKANLLHIGEISPGGSVPDLSVENLADKPVLLLDGEELVGGRQNRVLNLSVLLKEKSKTNIPVSCVERGRWHYNEPSFPDVYSPHKKPSSMKSGHIMNLRAREKKSRSVSDNICFCKAPKSDQGEVWNEIEHIQDKLNTHSETSALYDVYNKRKADLIEFLNNLKAQKDQCGYFLFINGNLQAFELIPKPDKYALYHKKLIESAALEALAEIHLFEEKYNEKKVMADVDEFTKSIQDAEELEFTSNGYGKNYRYRKPDLHGEALIHNSEVIHLAFFSSTDGRSNGRRGFMHPEF